MKFADKNRKGEIFTNDMSEDNPNTILEIHFCTSYTQVVVQKQEIDDKGVTKYITEDIIIPNKSSDEFEQAIDFIAVSGDEIGEWCELAEV